MKAVQSWILHNILQKVELSETATGFRERIGIRENALAHKDNQYILCMDVDNFFPTIKYSMVFNVFKTLGYNVHVSHILTSLCTCKGILPQGGVTSPIISNIICIRLDRRIAGYVGKHNVTYTRYADDLTFSSLSFPRLMRIKKFVERIIHEEGFTLNNDKTRFMGRSKRKKVTGLVISDKGVGIGKTKKRALRAKIYQLLKNKVEENDKPKLVNHINGWLAFLFHIDEAGVRALERYALSLDNASGLVFPRRSNI